MKVTEKHKSGASIEMEGDRDDVLAALKAWREEQDAKADPADEEPRVKGTFSSFSRGERFDGDQIESWSPGKKVPVIMGFVPNERNHFA